MNPTTSNCTTVVGVNIAAGFASMRAAAGIEVGAAEAVGDGVGLGVELAAAFGGAWVVGLGVDAVGDGGEVACAITTGAGGELTGTTTDVVGTGVGVAGGGGAGIATVTVRLPRAATEVMQVVPDVRSHTSNTLCAGACSGTVAEVVNDAASGTRMAGAAANTPFQPEIAVEPACRPAMVMAMVWPRATGWAADVDNDGPTWTPNGVEQLAAGEQAINWCVPGCNDNGTVSDWPASAPVGSAAGVSADATPSH